MTTKDWILLFAPILTNGILLFVFQKMISAKLDKQTRKNKLRLDVLDLFRQRIIEATKTMNRMKNELNQEGDASKEMTDYVGKIHAICEYYSTYKIVLSVYEHEITQLANSLNACINIINNRKGPFETKEIDTLMENLNYNSKLLEQLSEKCFKLAL